ncbi:LysR family transcriptional regulator [Vibrio natriegens]|uniref:LysR family transcriptional regulator n=1 Tax=Vibrio natriegens TaxID=691 RepID=UPI000804760A|nr:LysR family transcriptional regulator [Vibrio natriegens]ANQ16960.1 LysR family transcriptional regulator [Vibrio natriegens]
MRTKSTLEQWNTLAEVDRCGSIQAAAQSMNKSHTTLLYSIKKLEAQLGVSLVELEGRRTVLTQNAKVLLRRAIPMVEQARDLEVLSKHLSEGIEPEITIAMDHLCNREWLYQPMNQFLKKNNFTSVQVKETSLSSTTEAVVQQWADISIVPLPVENHLAEAFATVTMIPVVSKSHPLAQKTSVCNEDLQAITQVVARDLGSNDKSQNVGWLKAQRRITVDNFDHAWQAVVSGLGFCRIPDHRLAQYDTSQIVQLPLVGGERYQVPLHLVAPKGTRTGLAARKLYDLLLLNAKRRLGS